ncbi:TetR/AcrR family transcriptional regulator [Actinoplanes couchii]|uniref:Transcriptional regulator n=1 Tax=Actinoplanes couchii TaxID=403638 RepID=A0ABQ3XDP2_9ACTN|nr:TetR/AcrR family transcriptional regulator [Actinoplanes couchii]MDR6317108.1 AcrR family transcriptional regulator [Actinoplanes couchii]GID56603.1 transcriptional regulator [Actinoplanes couchii]
MPRAGLAPATVIAAGADLADEVGFAGLTMGLLAERVGVRTPSLYKHVDSLDALRRGIAILAKREFAVEMARASAGKAGVNALQAFAETYRRWALTHPGRYAATVRAPAPGDEEDLLASNEALRVLFDVLAGFGLHDDARIDAARMVRSALHGFANLESGGGFGYPQNIDRSYQVMVDTLVAAVKG